MIGEFSGIIFLKSTVLTSSYKLSKSSILSSSAKSKKTLFPTLDHRFTFAATSIVPSKVISLSTTSIIFHHCFSISFFATDSKPADTDNTNFLIIFNLF
jgi:hypothetical protein